MAISGAGISEVAIASGTNAIVGGGLSHSDSIAEPSTVMDQVSARAVFLPSVFEIASLATQTLAPGGGVADAISATLNVTDAYAGSGLWTAAARGAGPWIGQQAGGNTWAPVAKAGGVWSKQ